MFRFKQFTVHQNNCAMKVCTDACLFGAWVADKIERGEIQPGNILDIGTGTGLLSLMLAQQSAAAIDAVEIDAPAFEQATENIAASPWAAKIKIHHLSIADLAPDKKYDLIISNPPFYENQLRSTDEKRNAAMHDSGLSFGELALSVKKNLTEKGIAAILLPYDRVESFEKELFKQQLFITEKLHVSHSPSHPFFRSLLMISLNKSTCREAILSIKDNAGGYSNEFIALLKDYYLAF